MMKTTYLIYKQINGVQELVVATKAEWDAIMKENRGLPMEKRRCFMIDCIKEDGELDCMYTEMSTAEYRKWNSENTETQRKRKIGSLYPHVSLDTEASTTCTGTLHESVPSSFDLEELATDNILMEELRVALRKWKPWAEEMLDIYFAGAKRTCNSYLRNKYQTSERTVERWKNAFETFVLNFLKK